MKKRKLFSIFIGLICPLLIISQSYAAFLSPDDGGTTDVIPAMDSGSSPSWTTPSGPGGYQNYVPDEDSDVPQQGGGDDDEQEGIIQPVVASVDIDSHDSYAVVVPAIDDTGQPIAGQYEVMEVGTVGFWYESSFATSEPFHEGYAEANATIQVDGKTYARVNHDQLGVIWVEIEPEDIVEPYTGDAPWAVSQDSDVFETDSRVTVVNTGVTPEAAGIDGAGGSTWSGLEVQVEFGGNTYTFIGYTEGEIEVFLFTLENAPPGLLDVEDPTIVKGWTDSYSTAAGVIVGENQIFGNDLMPGTDDDYMDAALVHEMAHQWAGQNGQDEQSWALWTFGQQEAESFIDLDSAYPNEYARGCGEGAFDMRGPYGINTVDPRVQAASLGLMGEVWANTVHEMYVESTRPGYQIQWMDGDGNPLGPDAGQNKRDYVHDVLDW